MEPRVKRPRLVRDEHGHTSHLTETAFGHEYHAQPSNSFEGCGVQNTGCLEAGRDLVINMTKQSNTDIKAEKTRRINEKRQALLKSLRFKQMDAREWSIKKAHEKTCQWFLKTSEYIGWAEGNASHDQHNFLWIRGKPGAGKSTLMKFLLGQLRNQYEQATNEELILSFFFNARGGDLEKSTAGLYRSLLVQLLETRNDMLYVLDGIRIGHCWTIESLQNLFEKAVQELKIVSLTCLIDALDECEEAQIRDMVSFLSDITVIQTRVRVCFASRHYPHISIQKGLGIVLETQPDHGKDIASYIASRLIIRDQALATRIHELLLTKASGVFMWVVLVVSILNKEHDAGNEHILHERIQQFPDSLQDLFHGILTRDDNNTAGLLLCIQWVLFAIKPLTPKEMYFAIVSGGEAHNLARCHSAYITEAAMKRYILNTSKGLAEPTVSAQSTVQFIHESVRDFLLKENGLIRIWPSLAGNVIGRSHDILKQCCLTYISMNEVARIQGLPRNQILNTFPFLGYAYGGVLGHADQAQQHGVNQQDFLTTFPRSKWVEIHNSLKYGYKEVPYTSEVSLLYILAEANKPALIRAHPNRQSCFEIESEYLGIPLLAAYAMNSNAAIQTLMDLEAEKLSESPFSNLYRLMPERQPELQMWPYHRYEGEHLLQNIIRIGTERMSLLYLAKEPYYDINAKDQEGRTILNSAVVRGHYMLARVLLQSGANTSISDKLRQTPLHNAVKFQHPKLTILLIDHGANISAADELGQTPLHISSSQGDINITTILLDRGADVSATDHCGRTPLHISSSQCNIDITTILLDRGADVSAADELGQTPLHISSSQCNIDITTILLNRGADVSATDHCGRTPLHISSSQRNIYITTILLDRGADVSATDYCGQTPLHISSQGDIDITTILLNRDANVLATNRCGQTPLHISSSQRNIDITTILLDRGADVSATDHCGRTPLDIALAQWNYIMLHSTPWQSLRETAELAQILIDHGANVSAAADEGQSIIHQFKVDRYILEPLFLRGT